MIIKNPTANEIRVQIYGVNYVLPASGELKYVPAEHAHYWQDKLHNFLILADDVSEAAKPAKAEATKVEPEKVVEKTEKTK